MAELVIATAKGKILVIDERDVELGPRLAEGAKIIDVGPDDVVVAVARVPTDDELDAAAPRRPAPVAPDLPRPRDANPRAQALLDERVALNARMGADPSQRTKANYERRDNIDKALGRLDKGD